MAKGSKVELEEFPDVSLSWDNQNGRFVIKVKGVATPRAYLSPENWEWQLREGHSLKPLGKPIKDKGDAIRTAAKHYSKA